MKTVFFFFILTMGMLFSSCSSQPEHTQVTHSITFLNGSTNNKLEVLDWGGTGKPVIFLTGIGNSAHVFDEFAPKFTDRFHVYGLTRRCFGASEQTTTDYNTTTLTKDLVSILDQLHLDKVILIGHSISGLELSKLASTYPKRVEKIIYLDAAFDFSFLDTTQVSNFWLSAPQITTVDSSSLDRINEFNKKLIGVLMPTEEMKQTLVFSREGACLKDVTPSTIVSTIFKSVEHPDYAHIKCPALAIFATHQTIDKFIPFYSGCDATHKKMMDNYFVWFNRFVDIEMDRFKKGVRDGTLKTIPDAAHYIFISNPAETEKMIRDFL